MIQRIQSLWLLLAAGCMVVCLFVPVAKYSFENQPTDGQRVESQLQLFPREGKDMASQMGEPVVTYSQRMTGMETWQLVAPALACLAVALTSLLLFKRRTLQVRLVAVGFLINVVYVFVLFFWAVDCYANLLSSGMGRVKPEITWFIGSYAPLVSLVFFFLAQRAIKKDEALVRAADRLR